jgi:glycosyltransferase involved in cell wall biosynthesis
MIIVDDGSIDKTFSIASEMLKRIVVHVLCSKIQEQALETPLTKSSGRYIAFLDADDLWNPKTAKTN